MALLLSLAWRPPHVKVVPTRQVWKITAAIWAMYAVAAVYITVFCVMPVQLPVRLHDLQVAPTLVGLVPGAVMLAGLSALSLTRWRRLTAGAVWELRVGQDLVAVWFQVDHGASVCPLPFRC